MIEQLRASLGKAGPLEWIGIVALVTFLIFLPGIIAQVKRHPDRRLIWIGCVLLVWTFTGWVALMAWAITGVQSQRIRDWVSKRYGRKDDPPA